MPKRSRNSTILVWDVDDVLNSLTLKLLSNLGVLIDPENVGNFSNPAEFVKSLGVEGDDYLAALDDIRRHSFLELQPSEAILTWFHEFGTQFNSMALTSTPLEFFPNSAKWVMTHFQPWIDGIGCTPSRRESDPVGTRYRTKAEYLARLGERYVLIDDSLTNLVDIDPDSGRGMLYPTPWNGAEDASNFLSQLPKVC